MFEWAMLITPARLLNLSCCCFPFSCCYSFASSCCCRSWVLGEAVQMRAPSTSQSHLVLYAQPAMDYSTPPDVNIDRLMQHVCNSTSITFSVQDIMADADIYKASAAERAAALPAVPNGAATSAAAPPPNPVLRRVLAGAAAAAEAAAAAFGSKVGDAGDPAGSVSVAGLTLPLTAPEQSSAQQQLMMFLRRQLLPLRVAARRIAGAEVWGQHVAEQQQKRQQAASGGAGDKDEDAELLQGLADGAGAAAAAQANGTQEHPAVNGLSSDPTAAAAAAGEVDLGGLQQEVSRVMQQQQPRVAARAEQLLLQQPLSLEDLLGAFQAEALAASQQLNIQVCGTGLVGGRWLTRTVASSSRGVFALGTAL
jgi:hypothetical protein